MRHRATLASALCAAACSAASAQLTIHLTFDSSVTSNANSAQIQSACNYAAAQLQNAYADPVTVNIRVVAAAGTSILGQSQSAIAGPYSYAQIRGFLAARASTADDATVMAHLGTSDPTGGGQFYITTAQAKALGQRSANNTASDGTFSFGAGLSYTFDPNNRAVAGRYDFIGVAFHEMTEIMGRIPGLDPSGYMLHDLYRFSAPGAHAITPGTHDYFSIDGGATDLHGYNGNSGGDPDDWDSSTNDAFNAFTGSGRENALSDTDLRLMDVLGYARVSGQSSCYANCDQSTTAPVLNINDFICFQAKFAAGDPTANCDGSTVPPVLNLNDFVCFQARFAAGCP